MSKLPPLCQTHTEGFTSVNAFIQLCLTSTLFSWINKTEANQNMTFEHLNTIFHHVRGKHKQPFTFWYCVDNFYPWKDIVGKKVSKLRAIGELRVFYGIFLIKANISPQVYFINWKTDQLQISGRLSLLLFMTSKILTKILSKITLLYWLYSIGFIPTSLTANRVIAITILPMHSLRLSSLCVAGKSFAIAYTTGKEWGVDKITT